MNKARHDLVRRCASRTSTLSDAAAKLQTNAEIERIARERYNMALPGERAVLDRPDLAGDDHDHRPSGLRHRRAP